MERMKGILSTTTDSRNYRKYNNKNPLMGMVIFRFLDQLKFMIDSLDGDHILDVGCGEGFVINFLKNKNIIGIDISEGALTIAKIKNPENRILVGDIHNLPFQKDEFDIVVAAEILEHMTKPEKAIDEIIRVSKRYCIFSVPNEPYFKLMNLFRLKNISRFGNDIDHIQNWSSNGFVELLEKYFRLLEVKKPFPWTLVLCEKYNQFKE